MLYDKGSIDECMRCTRIKKHNCRMIGDRKHTQHHGFPFWNLPSLNIENPPRLLFIFARLSILVVILVLSLTLLLISRSLLEIWIILLRIQTFPREMTWLPTIETWVIVALGCWSTNTRNIGLLRVLVTCGRTDLDVALLGTTADDKEDDSDSLDDRLSSASFYCHWKTQMAHSFSF